MSSFIQIVALGTLTIAGYWLHLSLMFGIDLVFGSVFATVAAVRCTCRWAVPISLIGSLYTIGLWGHPAGVAIFTLETLFIALMHRRLPQQHLVVIDLIYWLLAIVPVALLFRYGMKIPWLDTTTEVLKQAVNGMINAGFASLLLHLNLFFRPKTHTDRRQPFSRFLLTGFVVAASVPTVMGILWFDRVVLELQSKHAQAMLKTRLEHFSKQVGRLPFTLLPESTGEQHARLAKRLAQILPPRQHAVLEYQGRKIVGIPANWHLANHIPERDSGVILPASPGLPKMLAWRSGYFFLAAHLPEQPEYKLLLASPLEPSVDQVREITIRCLVTGLAGLVAGLMLGGLIHRRVSRELEFLTAEAIHPPQNVHSQTDNASFLVMEFGLLHATLMTAHRQNRKALDAQRKIAERLRQIFAAVDSAIITFDHVQKISEWNPAAERLTGIPRGEALGRPFPIEVCHCEDARRLERALKKLSLELPIKDLEIRWCNQKSGAITHVLANARMVPNSDDKSIKTVLVCQDVTEHKQTQAQLAHSARLSSLGLIAAGIAHELNQPLNVIYLAAENLESTLDPSNEYARRKLTRIFEQIERAAGIVRQVRRLGGHNEQSEKDCFPLSEAVAGVAELLESQLRASNIDLRCAFSKEASAIQISGNRLNFEQVLINLLVNARDVLLERQVPDPWISVSVVREGSQCRVEVSDNGGGLDDAALHHAFDPFFSTKPIGKGMGLGLSLSFNFIEQMGGTMTVRNTFDGALFHIRLPIAETT
ncbi:MAG: PAS domain-containing sensor histidine kinase [Methylohalobius sp. ZOD2]